MTPTFAHADFNPRSPHGERHAFSPPDFDPLVISIHAPRTGSDAAMIATLSPKKTFQSTLPARGATRLAIRLTPSAPHFNPRSPHGERPSRSYSGACALHFNPRSPHGERQNAAASANAAADFNPRSPHGERPPCCQGAARNFFISIHAPRTGSDGSQC